MHSPPIFLQTSRIGLHSLYRSSLFFVLSFRFCLVSLLSPQVFSLGEFIFCSLPYIQYPTVSSILVAAYGHPIFCPSIIPNVNHTPIISCLCWSSHPGLCPSFSRSSHLIYPPLSPLIFRIPHFISLSHLLRHALSRMIPPLFFLIIRNLTISFAASS